MNSIDALVLRVVTLAEIVVVVLALLGQTVPRGTLCPGVWPGVWPQVLSQVVEIMTALRWAVM